MHNKPDVWTVLVVDDERDVYEVLNLAFGGVTMVGRPLQVHWSESGTSARHVIADLKPHIALIDIVMETEHAGFDLIEWVNETVDQPPVMMVYTGQPGVMDSSSLDTNRGVSRVVPKSGTGLDDLSRVIEAMLLECHDALAQRL